MSRWRQNSDTVDSVKKEKVVKSEMLHLKLIISRHQSAKKSSLLYSSQEVMLCGGNAANLNGVLMRPWAEDAKVDALLFDSEGHCDKPKGWQSTHCLARCSPRTTKRNPIQKETFQLSEHWHLSLMCWAKVLQCNMQVTKPQLWTKLHLLLRYMKTGRMCKL